MTFAAAATYESLVDEVLHNLNGFTQSVDHVAALARDAAADDTTIYLDDANGFSRGLVQIDDELLFVKAVDNPSNALNIYAFGRGHQGTTAAAHTSGAMVTMAPLWPRATIAREVNSAIRALYPDLFAVRTTTFTSDAAQYAYDLPAATSRVLDVKWREPSTTRDWQKVRHISVDHNADATDFPSGKSIRLGDNIPHAVEVRVTYAAVPDVLSASGDVFATTTGLPESVKDLVVLGACYRLTPYMDASRLPVQSLEADEMDGPRQLGTASQVSQVFLRMYRTRLEEERRALSERYPPQYREVF